MARGFDVSNGQQWSCSSGFNCDPYQSNVSKQPFGSHTHPADSGPRDATLPRVHFLSTLLLLREELLQSRSSRRRLIQLRRSDDLIHLFFLSIIHSYRNPRRTPDFPHFFLHFFFFFSFPYDILRTLTVTKMHRLGLRRHCCDLAEYHIASHGRVRSREQLVPFARSLPRAPPSFHFMIDFTGCVVFPLSCICSTSTTTPASGILSVEQKKKKRRSKRYVLCQVLYNTNRPVGMPACS
jgi:hypothetical protein